MSMYTPPKHGTTATGHNLIGRWCAWVSVLLPVIAGMASLFVNADWFVAPVLVYWASFVVGAVGFALGGAALCTTGRRLDWTVMTPALTGIALSLALCYFAFSFGILSSAGPVPTWGQIFPW